MLPLNEYESKSRSSLPYSVSGESEDHMNNRLNNAGGTMATTTSRRLNHNNLSGSQGAASFPEGLRGEAIYFPSPYALSRVVSVYESSDLAKGCPRQQQQSDQHTPSHALIRTPVHRQQQQHYDVPFKQQASL